MMLRTRSHKTAPSPGTVQSFSAPTVALVMCGALLPLIPTQTFSPWF